MIIRNVRAALRAVGWVAADVGESILNAISPPKPPHQPLWGLCEDRSAPQEFGRLHGLESGGEALEPGAYVPPYGFGCVSCDGDIATCGCWDDDDDEADGPGGRFYRKPEPVDPMRPAFDPQAYLDGLKWPEPKVDPLKAALEEADLTVTVRRWLPGDERDCDCEALNSIVNDGLTPFDPKWEMSAGTWQMPEEGKS